MPINVISKLKPINNGSFPVVEDVDIEGGYQVRDDTTDRNSIPSANRKEGMLVHTLSDGYFYTLSGGITNSDWVVADLGGSDVTIAGDLSGTLSSQTVIGIQTRPVNSAAPSTGDVLVWSGSQWVPDNDLPNLTVDGYKSLLVPTTIVLPLVAGLQSNAGTGAGSAIRIGATVFDPTAYSNVSTYLTRTLKIRTVLQASSGVTAELKVFNTDTAALVATFTSTSTSPDRQVSATIPIGVGAGQFVNALQTYEAQLRISAPGSPGSGDVAVCYLVQIEVAYA